MKSRREALVPVAVVALFVCACAAEDSVTPSTFPIGGSGSGGASGGAGGSSGAGSTSGAGGVGGMMAGVGGMVGGGAGGVSGMMAGVGGMAIGGSMGGTSGDGAGGTGATGGAQDADCDMNGIWVARMMAVNEALSLEQCGSQYFYFELKHEGANVEVVHSMFCGIEGRGSSNGTLSDASILSLTKSNSQVGRKGTMTKGADGTCQLTMEPFWSILGADEAMFAPMPRNASTPLSQVQSSTPLPTSAAGAIDMDSDGNPGLSIIVTGVIQGTRYSVQRTSNTWLTNDRYKITPAATWTTDIEARAEYYSEEVVVGYTPEDASLLASPSNMVPNSPSARVTLHFLGRDAAAASASGIVVASDPTADPDGAVATCKNILDVLPPINAISDGFIGQVCPCPGDKDGEPVCDGT